MNTPLTLKLNFALSLALIFVLSACGKSDEEKAQERVEDGNAKITQIEKLDEDLQGYGMTTLPAVDPSSLPSDLEEQDFHAIQKNLKRQIQLCKEVISIGDTKGVELKGRANLEYRIQTAETYLSLIKKQTASERKSDEQEND